MATKCHISGYHGYQNVPGTPMLLDTKFGHCTPNIKGNTFSSILKGLNVQFWPTSAPVCPPDKKFCQPPHNTDK